MPVFCIEIKNVKYYYVESFVCEVNEKIKHKE